MLVMENMNIQFILLVAMLTKESIIIEHMKTVKLLQLI